MIRLSTPTYEIITCYKDEETINVKEDPRKSSRNCLIYRPGPMPTRTMDNNLIVYPLDTSQAVKHI